MFLYNLYALNGALIEKRKTASYLKEEYGITRPDRYARYGMIVKGKFTIYAIEEK